MDQCGTCRHAHISFDPDDPEQPTMECRRYPPQVFVLNDEPAQAFPSIDSDMSCGEWAPDP
jgi:hypothetical protein